MALFYEYINNNYFPRVIQSTLPLPSHITSKKDFSYFDVFSCQFMLIAVNFSEAPLCFFIENQSEFNVVELQK